MPMQFKKSMIFDIMIALIFLVAIVLALGYHGRAGASPLVVSIPGLLVMLARIFNQLFRAKPKTKNKPESEGKQKPDLKKELNAMAWIFGLFVLIYVAGFIVAIPVYLFLFMKVRSQEKVVFSLIFSVVSCLFLYLFFIQLLHIPLYQGFIVENLL